MSMRIEIKDLNVYYGKFLAVEGVSMDIAPRSVTAFIGPSGCGKSTLIRTLNRMHEVIPGAYVDGEVCWELNVYDDIADAMAEAANEVGCAIKWGAAWSVGDITRYVGTMEEAMMEYVDLRRSQGKRPFIDSPHFELIM